MPNDSLFRLIDACCEAYDNPAFEPRQGMTFCNQAVHSICEKMGYSKFKSLLANQMVALMKKSGEWKSIPMKDAQRLANEGCLVIAAIEARPHGHVAVIRPGLSGHSGKWNMAVPKVINVGAQNFIAKGLNWAFHEIPEIFVWKGPISNS
jgi:hypothetical protein